MAESVGETHAPPMPSGDEKRDQANLQAMRESVKILAERVANSERRITVMERADDHHVAGIRQNSESDAKLASDQAGMAESLKETRKLAAAAVQGVARLEGQNKAIILETSDQTELLRKKPVWQISASAVSLLCAVIYLVIEVLKWLETHP